MGDKTWKRIEREKCRELGGERSGPTGRDTPDCDGAVHVALEVKSYKKFVFLTADWQQAVDNAAKVGKPPVLAVKERGHNGRDLVQLRCYDLGVLEEAAHPDTMPLVQGYKLIGRDSVCRIYWDDFVALYRAAFNNEEE